MNKHPQLTFIVRSPNGNIQLASQPAVRDIKLIQCLKCEKVNAVKGMAKVKCSQCGTTISASRCGEPGCKGEVEFVYIGSLIVQECSQCKKVEPFN